MRERKNRPPTGLRPRGRLEEIALEPIGQRRRIERAMFLLRTTDRDITDVCLAVGFASLGSFSRTFRAVVGEAPSGFRRSSSSPLLVPSCFAMAWGRPVSFGEARRRTRR